MKKLKFIDFCSGIGGARLALERQGLKCLGFSEIDNRAILTYKKLFDLKKEKNFSDLSKINIEKLPDFDLLISGFPCQSFSIVGKREGFNNKEKGQIIFYLAEILKIKQPQFFILENVKGLITHNQGKTLKTILNLLKKANYFVDYKVLNSLNFSLPQSRERVYFVGILKNIKIKNQKQFFNDFWDLGQEENCKLKDFLSPNKENKILKTSAAYQTFIKYLGNKYNVNKFNLEELFKENYLVLDTRQSDLRIYKNKVPTLRRDRQGIFYIYRKHLYKLSAIEALNLQGFYKINNLEEKISDLNPNDLLRQAGNAMSVNVIEELVKQLLIKV